MSVPRPRNYLLAVLFVVQVCNNVDAWALGLVLQQIKVDLALSDTQLGILTGIAFALLYSVVGIAIARWADKGNRVTILSLTATAWGVLVAACGAAASFWQLLVLRIGVGIGEAGCFPASQSLIADYFDRAERPRANAVFMMTAGVSAAVGYGVAGWLNELYGWRWMFVILGLPGLLVAVLVGCTLKDPRFERPSDRAAASHSEPRASSPLIVTRNVSAAPSLRELLVSLWGITTLRHLLFFWSVSSFFTTALWRWQPAFFVRSHGLNTAVVGMGFAIAYGIGGTIGPFLGGAWASRYASNNERLQLRVGAAACAALMVLSTCIYLVPSYPLAFTLLGVSVVISGFFYGPVLALIQTLVAERMRAAAAAILALLGNLVGNGLGSLATGALSDAFRARLGDDSLRYALLALCPGFLWAAWQLWQASLSVAGDLATSQRESSLCADQAHVIQ